jgi:crotonobetaine/carnitine-CoA ligase
MIPELEDFKKRFGVKYSTGYGLTETGGIISSRGWHDGPWNSCGRAREDYPWAELRVVNEFDEPLGPNQVGELIVRTAEPWGLNAGYYNDPEKTVEAWRNGWFHTGDAFRYDEEGWFYLVDRMKDSIRRRGENISSFEVESIAKNYPGIVEVAAIAVPAKLGEDDVMVCVETEYPEKFSPADFIKWLEPRMPKYMLPRYVEPMQALPRNTSTLRIKKYELRARGVTPQTWDREKPK